MSKKASSKILKNLLLIFSITMICALFTVTVSAETISGECGKQGDNVTWSFDTETGVLTIEGEGEMADYSSPWGDNIKDDIKKVIICDGVTSVGDGAFNDCFNLSEIELPKSLEVIGNQAFSCCMSLKSINIPANVKEIPYETFALCSSLEKITVDQDNQYYSSDDDGVLFNKDKTTLVKYPSGKEATEYKVPDNVKIIGEEAFAYCPYIKNVQFGNNLETVRFFAFAECCRLQNLSFPNGLKCMEVGAMIYCWSLKNVVLPESIKNLDVTVVEGCPALESLSIKSMDTQFDNVESSTSVLCRDAIAIDGISVEEFADLVFKVYTCTEKEKFELISKEISRHMVVLDEPVPSSTIRCHAGSTAEAYAKENGINYELVHFYGDWSYDWDNLVRSHKCDICGYTETEPLEKTEGSGVEIIKPIDPDTEFIVEEITKNGDKYAVIEKTLNENLEGSYSILKTFDITLKNKNGVHVQPNGTVKVKLPLDWDKDGNYKVYRVNDDGTLTDMEAYRQGSHMVFDSNHFSVYAIVDESPEQPGNDSPISFFSKLINMFKDFINKIIEFFRSLGDLT